MAPNRLAMQEMLKKCEEYADRNNIKFSTDPQPSKSKSKCIFVTGSKKNVRKPAPLILCGRELPWVQSATHLGHELHESGLMEYDSQRKRAAFIRESTEIREAFHFASPVEVISALKLYCSSFHGCMLWDFDGDGTSKVFNAWKTTVKIAWHVPRATRTYLVHHVLNCDFTSARVDVLARYAGFFQGLRKSPSLEVAVLANIVGRDVRSTTGSNLKIVKEASGLDPWIFGSDRIKKELSEKEVVSVPAEDRWRVKYLDKLLKQRQLVHYSGDEELTNQLSQLIDSLCVN